MTGRRVHTDAALRYPVKTLAVDVLQGAAGIVAVGAPLLLAEPARGLSLLLWVLLGLFVAHLGHSIARARRRYRLDDGGLTQLPGDSVLAWDALEGLRLEYYSTRRDGREGWMELCLSGGGRTLRVDSRLPGFEALVSRAARAAAGRGLALGPATRANLEALGAWPASRPT